MRWQFILIKNMSRWNSQHCHRLRNMRSCSTHFRRKQFNALKTISQSSCQLTHLPVKPWLQNTQLPEPCQWSNESFTRHQSKLFQIRNIENFKKNSKTSVWWPATSQSILQLRASSWPQKFYVTCCTEDLRLCEKLVGSFLMKFITCETKSVAWFG